MTEKKCNTCYYQNQRGNLQCLSCNDHNAWAPKFENLVAALVKPGESIVAELTPGKADLLHMAVGVAGEAGELVDAIKKHVIYNKPIDLDNVIEELGDMEFYMERIRQRLNIRREETIEATIAKLQRRYESMAYSDAAAQTRADKA